MKHLFTLALACAFIIGLTACQKNQEGLTDDGGVPSAIKGQIAAMGFKTDNIMVTDGGYVVEGDIFLPNEDLKSGSALQALRVGESEQYRTTNLVGGLPRNITISVSSRLPSAYVAAVDELVRRYNAENLLITFSRVSSNGNIVFSKSPNNAQYLASSGFPTSTGNPYNQVLVNSTYLGSNPGTNYLATIFAHEVGHCIGFRHTDYMDRSYSCGGSFYNEGASTVGAILIPGTPSGPDPNSWMLACIGTGVNRPFNSNDRTALNYLY